MFDAVPAIDARGVAHAVKRLRSGRLWDWGLIGLLSLSLLASPIRRIGPLRSLERGSADIGRNGRNDAPHDRYRPDDRDSRQLPNN